MEITKEKMIICESCQNEIEKEVFYKRSDYKLIEPFCSKDCFVNMELNLAWSIEDAKQGLLEIEKTGA